jgi:hypothetical protein
LANRRHASPRGGFLFRPLPRFEISRVLCRNREKAATAKQAREEEKASLTRQPLALRNSEINSDPGGETGFKAENRNG